jgi:hypothetical protein
MFLIIGDSEMELWLLENLEVDIETPESFSSSSKIKII